MRREDEGGAVTLLVAAFTVIIVAIASIAIDIGMQRVSRRDMQALADVVALDMVRRIDGRSVDAISTDASWQADLNNTVARNDQTMSVPEVSYELGTVTDTGTFIVYSGSQVPDAVQITAESDVDYAIAGGSGHVIRKAVASTESVACFKLGSWAANIDTTKSTLLNALLGDALKGSALNLTTVGYEGLAAADITLLDLMAELGVGSVDELVDTEVALGDLLEASANVLNNNSDTINASLLDAIRAGITNTLLVDVTIGDLLDLTKGGDSVLSTTVNVLDFVAGSIFVANGEHLLEVPSFAVNAGFLGDVALGLTVIETAQAACGPVDGATASTSQVDLSADGTLLNLPSILGLAATGTMAIDFTFAKGEGVLRAVNCPTTGSPDEGITVEVGSYLTGVHLSVPITLAGILGLRVAVSVSLNTTKPVTARDVTITVMPPYTDYDNPESTSSGSLGMIAMNPTVTAQVTAGVLPLGLSLSSIVSSVRSLIVNPLLTTIETSLLPNLQRLLGLSVGGADVFAVPRPECSAPVLSG